MKNIVLTYKNHGFSEKKTSIKQRKLNVFCVFVIKKLKNLQFVMLFHVIFAKIMLFTSQNNVFHENGVFFFFIFFWKLSWVGGGASHLSRAV